MADLNDIMMGNLSKGDVPIEDIATYILQKADDTLYSAEAAAVGAGLMAAAMVGYQMRHPEIAMFVIGEGGDVLQEMMSEIGGLSTVAEVGGD